MPLSLDRIVAEASEGMTIKTSITTNENDGIAAYAEGSLSYYPAHLQQGEHRPTTFKNSGFSMYFSDRRTALDGPLAQKVQPFSVNAKEVLEVSLVASQKIMMTVRLFGQTTRFPMTPMGALLVGVGPQFGSSPEAVWVLAFLDYWKL